MLSKLCCCCSASATEKDTLDSRKHIAKGIVNKAFKKEEPKKPLDPVVVTAIKESNIFKHVFEYLTVNELLKCRLTNKFFNKVACEQLRHRIEGVVVLQRGLDYYVKLMSKSLDVPVGRVFLRLFDMTNAPVNRFFNQVGHSIVYLVLNLEGNSFSSFLKQIHHLENLKELSLNLFLNVDEYGLPKDPLEGRRTGAVSIVQRIPDIKVEDTSKTESFTPLTFLESIVLSSEQEWKKNDGPSVEKLIRLAPNVRNVNLMKWPFSLPSKIFQVSPLENLKFLEVRTVCKQGLEDLATKDMKVIKSIQLELGFDVESDVFTNFLESVSKTVEYIEIKNELAEELTFTLPAVMSELLTLRLTAWKGIISLDSILANAPKLDKLQMSRISPVNLELEKETKKANSVQYLAVNYEDTSHSMKSSLKALKNFVLIFPNIKFLMLKRMTDKQMELIYDGWPALEMLSVTTTFGFSDSGLTGIPMVDLKKIPQRPENQIPCGCYVPSKAEEEARVAPFIGRLKYLKDLRIDAEPGTKMVITNLSIHMGIQYLSDLNSLKITSQELGTAWCLRTIADNLVNLKELMVMDRAISNDRYIEQDIHYLLRTLRQLKLTFVPVTRAAAQQLTVPNIPILQVTEH